MRTFSKGRKKLMYLINATGLKCQVLFGGLIMSDNQDI